MKRGLTVAVAGAAILVAGVAGCSSNNSTTPSSSSSSSSTTSRAGTGPTTTSRTRTTTTTTTTTTAAALPTKVIFDGQDQHITGAPICSTGGGYIRINLSNVSVQLFQRDPPQVNIVDFEHMQGSKYTFVSTSPIVSASVTQNGKNYVVKGTAYEQTGHPDNNPTIKSFEIDATCPN